MIPRDMATYAIGDLHGEARALDGVLRQFERTLTPADTVVLLGDYVDRGPDSKGCVDRILELRTSSPATVVTLMGNHEDWMLRARADNTHHSWLLAMEAWPTIASYSQTVADELRRHARELRDRLYVDQLPLPYDLFFDALPAAHLEFFTSLALFHRTPEAVLAHAGVDPGYGSPEKQPQSALVWAKSGRFPDEYVGPDLVVYGHHNDARHDEHGDLKLATGSHCIGIDTIKHGVLTAIRLPGRKLFRADRSGAKTRNTPSSCLRG
jgi:serine/threonine protein phosphatase 1